MKRLIAPLLLLLSAFPAASQQITTHEAKPTPPGAKFDFPAEGIARYVGSLSDEVVDRFISGAEARSVKYLLISSQGGTVLAGVRLGEWVRSRGVSVAVDQLCMSSCANYVFPAGREKIIRPHSLVVWHGGAEQKNFREMRQRLKHTTEVKTNGGSLSADEERFHAENARFSDIWEAQVGAQKTLLTALQVDEYITRVGQEPFFYGRPWTVPLNTMKLFGISDVLADENYGTLEYVNAAARHIGLKQAPISLEVTRKDGVLSIKLAGSPN
jgi:hypothetical protein